MASLTELARLHTDLDVAEVGHLKRLVASWGLLADFCFSDLLLFVPEKGTDGARFVVLGQIRPTTGQTVHRRDWVGTVLDEADREVVGRTFHLGEIIEGEVRRPPMKERVRVLGIPIRWQGAIIGVLTRESTPSIGRQPGELERTYVEVFSRFARMIAGGEFPFAREQADTDELPRVGDGVIVLDAQGRVEYTSPNSVSALHRLGVHANAEGARLSELGFDDSPIKAAFAMPGPVTREIEQRADVTVVVRCIPLLEQDAIAGAVVLLRDISELRRRDRLLLSKDATIREIHHRVKNNLQTISSLLRLQGRRLESPEAKAAIEESVRRVRSIALVHEILSREAGDAVPFIEIVRPLTRMIEEALHTSERPVRVVVEGEAANLPAIIATPLAVVINELLQNAYDHAYPIGPKPIGPKPIGPKSIGADPTGGFEGGRVVLSMARRDDELWVRLVDDGAGLPPGFDLEHSTGLGLSIVRTLVRSELNGEIELTSGDGPPDRPGTVVTLRVPTLDPRPD